MAEPPAPPENNYLYYVIEDDKHQVRGHVIGSQHWVEPKDKNLNPRILRAIKRSALAVLEQPPGSPLLPSEPDSFNHVIKNVVEKLNLSPGIGHPEVNPALEAEIEIRMADIKGKTPEEGYRKVAEMVKKIKSSEDRLKFVREIQKNMFEFNLVSLEANINTRLKDANVPVESLEVIELREVLNAADERVKLRLAGEGEIKKVDEQLAIDNLAHEEELYRAWVKGDAPKITELLNKGARLNPEPPEIDEVHTPRAQQMAQRIIDVVSNAKPEEEVMIMMGCSHLLSTFSPKRTNIIAYLNERFRTDLSGWSITQIPSPPP